MNMEEFRDKAYEIATGNCLVETFNKKQYDAMNEEEVFVYVWEPFENFSSGELCSQIEQIANDIINAYKELISGSTVIINDNQLLEDTVEGMLEVLENKYSEKEVRDFLDENEMSFVMEEMFDAQSNAIQNLKEKMIMENEGE